MTAIKGSDPHKLHHVSVKHKLLGSFQHHEQGNDTPKPFMG